MLEQIESLILTGVKTFLEKDVNVAELQALYSIYRDLRVIINGKIDDKKTQDS